MADEEVAAKTRRSYGRGYFDGLRAAGVDPEGFMNERKRKEAEESLTEVARSILDAIPIKESWGLVKVCDELRRKHRVIESKAVNACIASLVAQGLVRETRPGLFCRVSPQPGKLVVPTIASEAQPIDVLASIASRLHEIADDIESYALGVTERIEAASDDTKKLRQLQAILKSIGD